MALPATIYKTDLNVADNDRAYYGSHSLTLARHPSETDERLMVRLLAYALNADADENLRFTRGLSEVDEPELWRLDLTGAVQTWIEVGTPDERRILKACGRADEVIVYAYGRNAPLWWSGVRTKLRKAEGKLRVYLLPADATATLAGLARRNMSLNINIQDGAAWISADTGEATVDITPA
ncbi:YaeQ family protein [Kerstersia similis]|uniref:YaeQ family protein n=1 Tax=Kerstersia similis TaxID=206505 RepID=UPI0039EE4056